MKEVSDNVWRPVWDKMIYDYYGNNGIYPHQTNIWSAVRDIVWMNTRFHIKTQMSEKELEKNEAS